jgi:hypothetical protein
MLDGVLDAGSRLLKRLPFWHRIEPLFLLLLLFLATNVAVHQYVDWQYGLSPDPGTYVRSFLFRQVTIAFILVVLVYALLRKNVPDGPGEGEGVRAWVGRHRRWVASRIVGVSLLVWAAALVFVWTTPSGAAANVRVKFHPPDGVLSEMSFDPWALTYLLYELNREQQVWQLAVDFDEYDPLLTGTGEVDCDSPRRQLLCSALEFNRQDSPGGEPLILLTHEGFGSGTAGRSYYWLHWGPVSVVSYGDWAFENPNVYEYLVYSIIVHSLLIHLDASCTDFSAPPRSDSVRGGTFEPQVNRPLMQASVMASHLSGDLEELLLNCFGPAYAADAARLLSLDWLRDPRVQSNLASIDPRVRSDSASSGRVSSD